jgi:hypothetical protein
MCEKILWYFVISAKPTVKNNVSKIVPTRWRFLAIFYHKQYSWPKGRKKLDHPGPSFLT